MRRTALMFALAGMVGALVATPIAVYATHQFTDVSDSAFYSNSVTAGTHTFALTITARNTVGFGPASVWALFVPFDGDGNTDR